MVPVVKNMSVKAEDRRDTGQVPGLGISLGGGHSNILMPGEFHRQRILASYSPRGRKEWDMTEVTYHAHI